MSTEAVIDALVANAFDVIFDIEIQQYRLLDSPAEKGWRIATISALDVERAAIYKWLDKWPKSAKDALKGLHTINRAQALVDKTIETRHCLESDM